MNHAVSPPIVFKNARLVLPDEVQTGSLSVEAGRIAGFGASNSSLPQAIDLEGDYLMPGFIEVHTDNFERHLMPRPKVQWAEMPALLAHDAEIAAAGITTVFDALGVGDADHESLRGTAWDAVLQTLDACTTENVLRADHHLHVRCELPAHNTIDLFQPFHGHERLSLISLMDHTPGQRQWENIEHAWIYFTGKKGWSQAKFEERVAQSKEHQARYAARHPVETLEFFGIKQGDTVVEALPGEGWYSKILLPYLGAEGRLIAVDYSLPMWPEFGGFATPEFIAQRKAWPAQFAVDAKTWGGPNGAKGEAYTFADMPAELTGKVDAVLFIRALHNLARFDAKGNYLKQALAETHRVLKPGGRLWFCEHGRAPDAAVLRWQNRLTPLWKPLAGGCHLNRDIAALISAGGFSIGQLQHRYLKGPKAMTYLYQGWAT